MLTKAEIPFNETNVTFQHLQATALVRKNSLAFVEQVFTLQAARQLVVLVSDATHAQALPGLTVDRCIVPDDRTGWFSAHYPLSHDDIPAQVTYTSGTEGQPKGILLTAANLADAAQRIISQMGMTSEIREYVGVPATFSFGMARYRAISAVGGMAYLPPRGFDPAELARMLAAGEVNSLAVVPTLLRILLASPELIRAAGARLRWMEIGSQHMTADEKRAVRALFPNAVIVQHYGLTEASRSTFLSLSQTPDHLLGSVGCAVGRTEVQIGDDGRIRIRGPHVARSRVDADGLHDLQDADGWLQTNDMGHIRDGHLFFDGRADDLINCGGVKLVPDQLEDRIRLRLDPGMQVAVARVADAQRGDGILVAVQAAPSATAAVTKAAVAALQDMGIAVGSALHVIAVDRLPVTATGKVQRRVLSEQFAARQPDPLPPDAAASASKSDVLSLFRHEFPGQTVGPNDSFETLGGDSLRYIQFSLAFEQSFGQLPVAWEKLSVAELQRDVAVVKKTIWRRLEAATLTRAFFVVCIVALHTEAFIYSPNNGAAYFLILLGGYSLTRFQLPEIIRTGNVKTLLGTVIYVAVPTVILVALLEVVTRKFELPTLLLYSNYVDPHQLRGFLFYFMEIYIQLFLAAAVLFSLAPLREAFRTRPMQSAVTLLLAVILLDHTVEYFWNGDYNYHRTPWHYGWAFTLGIVVASATDTRSRLVAMACAIGVVLLAWGPITAAAYVAGGCAVVLFVRSITVPAPAKIVIGEIAGASLFIFLCHEPTMDLVRKIFGENRPWTELFASIVVGIVVAHVYALVHRTALTTFVGVRDAKKGLTNQSP